MEGARRNAFCCTRQGSEEGFCRSGECRSGSSRASSDPPRLSSFCGRRGVRALSHLELIGAHPTRGCAETDDRDLTACRHLGFVQRYLVPTLA
eukprot:931237-Rhodomonas_salina.1